MATKNSGNLKSWTIPVEKVGDDLALSFPDELLDAVDWKIGDVLQWSENKNGSWTLRKVRDGKTSDR